MRKIDMTDVTFLFPLRVDSSERLANLSAILDYLTAHIDAEYLILEADTYMQGSIFSNRKEIVYKYTKDNSPVFHHTYYRNEMIKSAVTPIVALWDVDVIVPLSQLDKAVKKIRNKESAMTWPYDGICYSVLSNDSRLFHETGNINLLTEKKNRFTPMFGLLTTGGAFLANRVAYMEIGMENEHFFGWGPEDAERLKRATILGLPVYRVPGELFHLWHPRGNNSGYRNKEHEIAGYQEFLKICQCSRNELLKEISTWEWIKKK